MIRSLLFLVGIVPLLLMAQSITLTPDELSFVKEHPIIRLGGDQAWEPQIVDRGIGIEGIEREILDEIEKVVPLSFEIVAKPWKEIVHEAETRQIDGLVYSSPQPSRTKNFLFSHVYNHFNVAFYSRSNAKVITSIEGIKGGKVAVQASDQFAMDFLDSVGLDFIAIATRREMVEAILSKRVDFLFSALDMHYYLIEKGIPGIRLAHIPSDQNYDLVYSIRKDWPELVSILNKAIQKTSSSKIDAITEKWLKIKRKESGCILTQGEDSYLKGMKSVHLFTLPNWMPIMSVSAEGDLDGLLVDYLTTLNSCLEVKFRVMGLPYAQLPDSVINLRNTLFVYPGKFLDTAVFHYSKPILQIPQALVMSGGQSFYDDLGSLGSIRVGIDAQNPYISQIQMKYPNLDLVPSTSVTEMLEKVMSDKLDGYVGAISTLNYYMQTQGYSSLRISSLTDVRSSLYFASRSDTLIHIIDRAMDGFMAAESQNLIRKWYGKNPEVLIDSSLALQIGLVSALIVLFLVIWISTLRVQGKKRSLWNQELQTQQANLSAMIENSNALIYSLDRDMHIIARNKAFDQFIAYASDKPLFPGADLMEYLPITIRQKWYDRYQRALYGEKYRKEDSTDLTGEMRHYITSFNPIRWKGQVVGVSCITEDVTDYTRLSRYMVNLMKHSRDIVYFKDLNGRLVLGSQSLANVAGVEKWEDLSGRKGVEVVPEAKEEEQEMIKTGIPSTNKEVVMKDASGALRWYHYNKDPIYDQSGNAIGIMGIGRDVSRLREIRQGEKKLASAIESSQDMILFFDMAFNITYINEYGKVLLGVESISNYSEIVDEVTYKVMANGCKKVALGQGHWAQEFDVVVPGGQTAISMDHQIIVIKDENGEFLSFADLARNISDRNKLQMQVLHARLEKESMAAAIYAENQERQKIAHEIHDGIQQKVASVNMYLQGLEIPDPHYINVRDELVDKLNDTIDDIRGISHRLLPRALKNQGLVAAIQDEVDILNRNNGTHIHFYYNISEARYDEETELNLFRIFQEATTNALKHAQADEITVQLIEAGGRLSLTVEDNGVGFVPDQVEEGFGFNSLKSRADLLEAHLEVCSRPVEGTLVLIEINVINRVRKN